MDPRVIPLSVEWFRYTISPVQQTKYTVHYIPSNNGTLLYLIKKVS